MSDTRKKDSISQPQDIACSEFMEGVMRACIWKVNGICTNNTTYTTTDPVEDENGFRYEDISGTVQYYNQAVNWSICRKCIGYS
jgi:hypothetical protein